MTTFLFVISPAGFADNDPFSVGEVEKWVNVESSWAQRDHSDTRATDGVRYLYLDRQINAIDLKERSTYFERVLELTNNTGVRERSVVEIEYDPTYESVVVHSLGISRSGRYIDKLSDTKLESIRTEHQLENLLYNGTQTLTAILKDIRVGDVLQYSYTLNGVNPVYSEMVEYTHRARFYASVSQSNFRLIAQDDLLLHFRTRDMPEGQTLEQETKDGIQEVSWSEKNLKPLVWVDNEPGWERKNPSFTISSVGSWGEIVDWSIPLYNSAAVDSEELSEVASKIKRRYSSTEKQIGAASQWVQEEIRYFGIELGDNSHNPSPATETLERRFGDCKDKTVLLIALLQKLGIDANPALVNTRGGLRSDHQTRRLHAFDHVIVSVELNGVQHWIDPTRTNQRGALGEFFEPDFGNALIIAEGQTGLTKMNQKRNLLAIDVIKIIDIDKQNKADASLSVRTGRKGLSAERHRRHVQNEGIQSITNSYLSFFRDHYNLVESDGDVRISDFPRNSMVTTEQYSLQELWTTGDQGVQWLDIVSEETRNYLHIPKSPKYRDRAYSLDHPVSVRQLNVINYPEGIVDDHDAEETVSNPYFTYTVKVSQDSEKNKVAISHKYVSHNNAVSAEDIDEYVTAVEQAWELSAVATTSTGLGWEVEEVEVPVAASPVANTYEEVLAVAP